MEDLDGDGAIVAEVMGEEDRGHAAVPELALEGVPGRQCLPQPLAEVHGREMYR
jgi:hypothetical protein